MTLTGWVLYFFIISPANGTQPQTTTALAPQVFATTASCNYALGYMANDLDTHLSADTTIRAYCVPQTYKGTVR